MHGSVKKTQEIRKRPFYRVFLKIVDFAANPRDITLSYFSFFETSFFSIFNGGPDQPLIAVSLYSFEENVTATPRVAVDAAVACRHPRQRAMSSQARAAELETRHSAQKGEKRPHIKLPARAAPSSRSIDTCCIIEPHRGSEISTSATPIDLYTHYGSCR